MNQDNDPTVLVNYVDTNGQLTKKSRNIAGVRGWLALLVFGLIVLMPLTKIGGIIQFEKMHLAQLAEDINWQSFKNALWIIELALGTLGVTAGLKLWKKHSYASVKFSIVTLWVIGPLGSLLKWGAATFTIGHSGNDLDDITNPSVGLILAGIFTAYLLKSIRVKNTYIFSS